MQKSLVGSKCHVQEQICYFLTCVNCNDIFNYDIMSCPLLYREFLVLTLGELDWEKYYWQLRKRSVVLIISLMPLSLLL